MKLYFPVRGRTLLILMVLALVTGCTRPEPVAIRSQLFDSPACPPSRACWRNIVFGISELNEIYADQPERASLRSVDGIRYYNVDRGAFRENYVAQDGIIVAVTMSASERFDTNLNEVLSRFGINGYIWRGRSWWYQPLEDSLVVFLYYPSLGYVFRFVGPERVVDICQPEDFPLSAIKVMPPGDIATMVASGTSVFYTGTNLEVDEFIETQLTSIAETVLCEEVAN